MRPNTGFCGAYHVGSTNWLADDHVVPAPNASSRIVGYLQLSDSAAALHDPVIAWVFATGITTHVLLVAGLKNPTVRRRYLAVRELLAEYGQLELYEILRWVVAT